MYHLHTLEKRMDVDEDAFKGDSQVSPALSDANTPVELPLMCLVTMVDIICQVLVMLSALLRPHLFRPTVIK